MKSPKRKQARPKEHLVVADMEFSNVGEEAHGRCAYLRIEGVLKQLKQLISSRGSFDECRHCIAAKE